MKRLYPYSFCLLLAFSLLTGSLHAQVFVKHDATGNSDGTSWENAYNTVEKALANVTSGEIWIAAGTYKPGGTTPDANSVFAITTSNVALYGGFNGTETSLSERDPATNITILSGDINGDDIQNDFSTNKSDNTLHVVFVDTLLSDIIIDGFTIIGGHTGNDSDAPVWERAGGGIFALSPVTVNACTFKNNFARSGGCIYLPAPASGSLVTQCTFAWNATTSQSAGVFVTGVDGFTLSECTFTNNQTVRGAFYTLFSNNINVSDCTFSFNTNTQGPGGAMWNYNSTNVVVANSTFNDNSAPNSGALYFNGDDLMNTDDANNFILTNCTFTDNQATSGIGGAIRNRRGSYLIDGCVFTGNTSTGSGGHIRNDTNGDQVFYKNCRFEDGTSGGFGGAHTCYGEGTFSITNCEYINNTCDNFGGAVNSGLGAYNVTFDHCTFIGNSSSNSVGGALSVQNDSTNLNVFNSVFTNNNASTSGGAIYVGGSQSTVVGNCDFVFNIAGSFGGAISLNEGEVDISNLDVQNSTFSLNQAGVQGGAISLVDANSSLVSCLFAENTALNIGTGGALSLNASDSNMVNVSILHCTISNNSGDLAAGIAQWTGVTQTSLTTTIQNSILDNPGGNNYTVEDGTPTMISNGGNLSTDATLQNIFTQTTDLNGVQPTYIDPDNFDYTLTTDSPGIDAGIPDGAPEFDILGNPRINEPDMGAFENQNVTATRQTIVENKNMLIIAPNPVADRSATATLRNNWNGPLQLSLTNAKGQLMRTQAINKSNNEMHFQLPLSGLPAGIYQVAVSNGVEMVTEKVVVLKTGN
ncbi:MAG TPA: T9SS type A sorting domain-containing protein [Bacteroidetes bacterium]|nr:T9SS type A sorting domain-containing protein [Bacteroidota bacterium]